MSAFSGSATTAQLLSVALGPADSRGRQSEFSLEYIVRPSPHCFSLLRQLIFCAVAFARERAGNNKPDRIAIMAITTSNSMRVNARGPNCGRCMVAFIGSFIGGVVNGQ